jgi:hypothetical protein
MRAETTNQAKIKDQYTYTAKNNFLKTGKPVQILKSRDLPYLIFIFPDYFFLKKIFFI